MRPALQVRFSLLSLILAAGCVFLLPTVARAQSVRANWMQNAPFSDYRTYEWVAIEPTIHPVYRPHNHPFYRQYVSEYVNYVLTKKKGLVRVSASQSPDLLVDYFLETREAVDTNTYYTGMWGMGSAGTSQQPRTTGLLTVELIDARSKQIVWRGQATEDNIITDSKGQEKQVAKAIFKMFEHYPPPNTK